MYKTSIFIKNMILVDFNYQKDIITQALLAYLNLKGEFMDKSKYYKFKIDYNTNHFNEFPHDIFTKEEKELYLKIKAKKEELGNDLVILAHHYQSKWITELGDFVGDSFQLSKEAAERKDAKKIIFAGVHFMAESADILSDDSQKVYLPNVKAGCPMADMTTIEDLEFAWKEIADNLDGEKIIPITYMNSTAAIKAFCGRNGGAVCTSSNADKIFKWAFTQGDKIMFMPDMNLGTNTANKLKIPKDEQIIYDLSKKNGGATKEQLKKAKVISWNGYCHVHKFFNAQMVQNLKDKFGDNYKLVVHPEANPEIIEMADSVGSTKHIVDYIKSSKPGDVIAVGTEINLIYRLAEQYPDRTIIPIRKSLCPNMYRINMLNLYETIMEFPDDRVIIVDGQTKKEAKLALERMLEFG